MLLEIDGKVEIRELTHGFSLSIFQIPKQLQTIIPSY